MDERLLDSGELYEFMRLVYGWTTSTDLTSTGISSTGISATGISSMASMDPETQWSAFEGEITAGNGVEGKTYHPLQKRAAPWINIELLRKVRHSIQYSIFNIQYSIFKIQYSIYAIKVK